MRFDIWQGDLEPLQVQLTGVTDLTGATVSFVMAQVNGVARVVGQATIDDPVQRLVHYAWTPGETDVPGVYRAVFKSVLSGGAPETFPADEPIYIVIHPSL